MTPEQIKMLIRAQNTLITQIQDDYTQLREIVMALKKRQPRN